MTDAVDHKKVGAGGTAPTYSRRLALARYLVITLCIRLDAVIHGVRRQIQATGPSHRAIFDSRRMNSRIVKERLEYPDTEARIDAHRTFRSVLETHSDFSCSLGQTLMTFQSMTLSWGNGVMGFGGRLLSRLVVLSNRGKIRGLSPVSRQLLTTNGVM